MSPRTYRSERRARTARDTRMRILEATVALHAEHGALGTSHAMIAKAAGVSPQTVYNHFPDLGRLVIGCTGHVMSRAPAVDAKTFAGETEPGRRLRRLVTACYRQLDFLSPWLRLGHAESATIPELAELFDQREAELRDLLAEAIRPLRTTREFTDIALTLLDYPAFVRLARGRTPRKAAALAARYLNHVLPAPSRPGHGESE